MTMPTSRQQPSLRPPAPAPFDGGAEANRFPGLERAPRPRLGRPLRNGIGGAGAAFALVLAASVIWGFSGVIIKGIFDAGVGPLEIAFWRLLLGGGLFALHAGCRNELKLASRSDAGMVALFAFVGIALHYAAYNIAIERGGISLANLFLASVPVLVALSARIFLGERLTPWKLVLGALSAAGLVLVASGGGNGVDANLVSVGAGVITLLTAVGYVVIAKNLLQRISPLTLSAFAMPLAALMLLPFVSFEAKTPHAWLLLGVLTVVSTYGAHLFYQMGLKRAEASKVALLINVEAVTALATAALLFGERLTALGMVGVVLILAAAALVVRPRPPAFGRLVETPALESRRVAGGGGESSPAATA